MKFDNRFLVINFNTLREDTTNVSISLEGTKECNRREEFVEEMIRIITPLVHAIWTNHLHKEGIDEMKHERKLAIKEIVKEILSKNTENNIHNEVADGMSNYVDVNDVEDYDDLFEAYEELGRGQSESDVLNRLIAPYNLRGDDFCEVFDALRDEWNLNID